MERIRINSINEIYDGKNLLIKDFINLDLSNIDLSIIPMDKWEGCIFHNTSFKNTGIKFIPNRLNTNSNCSGKSKFIYSGKNISMYDCDFSDNDLTYLKKEDFYNGIEIGTKGCDFTNTGINFLRTLVDIKLDISYQEYGYNSKYWSFEYGTVNWPDFIDINTIIKNPHLNVPSFRVMNAISYYLFEQIHINLKKGIISVDNISLKYMEEMVKKCEYFLEFDKQGYGKKLYYKLLPFMDIEKRYMFFCFDIKRIGIKNVDFEDIPCELLRYYTIQNNTFENIVFNNTLSDLLKLWGGSEHFLDTIRGYENKYINVSFPNITYSSWQENPKARKRISESSFTFFTKVYLELDRLCNARCDFCRNKTFDKCNYDLDNIKNTLFMIKNYVNAVVIGGGEPTLRINDIIELYEYINNNEIDWHMFTNGTDKSIVYNDYIMDNFKINLSRHAINDLENANVFKVDSGKIIGTKDIEKLNIKNKEVTLNATCFKGGLDSVDKIIDYINYAKNIGCKKVLIQNLQTNNSLGTKDIMYNNLEVSEEVFRDVIKYLQRNNYRQKPPIYATGGYVSYVFKEKSGFTVSIQCYISYERLKEEWPTALKKAFDLSIDPSGILYENWHQKSGMVKTLKKND